MYCAKAPTPIAPLPSPKRSSLTIYSNDAEMGGIVIENPSPPAGVIVPEAQSEVKDHIALFGVLGVRNKNAQHKSCQ